MDTVGVVFLGVIALASLIQGALLLMLARRQFQTYLVSYRQLLERQLQELAVLGGDAADAAADELQRAYRRQA